jgi:hypothetical protein
VKAFTALVRTRIFTFLRAWSIGDGAAALASLDPGLDDAGGSEAWTTERLKAQLDEYRVEHPHLRFDPEARNLRHTHVTVAGDGRSWLVQQVLVDPEEHDDWVAAFEVDLAASREENRPVMRLQALGPL